MKSSRRARLQLTGWLLAMAVAALTSLPGTALAHFGNWGSNPCTNCHTVEAGGTFYVMVDGVYETDLTVAATPGQTLEIDYYFSGARGANDTTVGVLWQVPTAPSLWTVQAGTANAKTSPSPNWDSSWDALGTLMQSLTTNYWVANYSAAGAYIGGNGTASDDASETDGVADRHGADFRVTVPPGASGAYQIVLYGVGHTGNSRRSKSVTLTVNVAGGDVTKPTVNTFTATTPVNSNINIPITAFTASDNTAVTGYMITQSATAPLAGDAGWTGTAPTTFTATAGDGTKALYPWAKDAAGNVSNVFGPVNVLVDSTPPTDGSLSITPGNTQNAISWTAASDSGSGLRTTNTYDLRFLAGATPPTCATGTSVYLGTGSSYTHTGLTNGTTYSYRLCAYDNVNNVSTGAFGSGTPALVNNPPAAPPVASLVQYKSDGTTVVTKGVFTNSASPVMKGTVTDPEANTVQLEVEIVPYANGFTNTPNCTSGAAVASGATASATCGPLADGRYKWQARGKDSNGATGAWSQY